MTHLSYKQIAEPNSDQISAITNGLNRFGLEQTGGEAPERLTVVCESETGNVIAGAIGHSLKDRFYLTQLWVTEAYRSEGVGTELVKQIEAVAKARNCKDIVVDTLNAKAVPFYERLGYKVYMINKNYLHGFDWYFLIKQSD